MVYSVEKHHFYPGQATFTQLTKGKKHKLIIDATEHMKIMFNDTKSTKKHFWFSKSIICGKKKVFRFWFSRARARFSKFFGERNKTTNLSTLSVNFAHLKDGCVSFWIWVFSMKKNQSQELQTLLSPRV